MTESNGSEPTVQQQLTQLIQSTNTLLEISSRQENKLDSLGEKLEAVIDQFGHFTEGLVEIKLLVQEQTESAKQQAESAKQQAESAKQQAKAIEQQAKVAELQAESVSQLIALLQQKEQSR